MSSPTQLVHLDCPLITDGDAPANGLTGLYYSLGSFGGKWAGGALQRSADGINFLSIGVGRMAATWGLAANVLGDIPNLDVWDMVNSLQVRLLNPSGLLAGASDSAVLDGANMGALVKTNGDVEIIQWGSAMTVSSLSGTYVTLSRLLRGVRGTEWAGYGYQGGEVFVALDGTQKRFLWALSELQARRWYRGITVGANSASPIMVRSLRGSDLKPYAPVRVNGVFDAAGNLIISWLRRTRIGGENDWLDGVTDVPLSEASESYEVDILGPAGVPIRTLTKLSEPTAVYAASLQAADWGGNPPTISDATSGTSSSSFSVVVYQLSASVGCGFGAAATVPQAWPPALAATYLTSSGGALALDASGLRTSSA